MDKIKENTINPELTEQIRQDSSYRAYCQWLTSNGCIAPSIDFPVAFGPSGLIGASARRPIPPNKAYLFVPYSLSISIPHARSSPIGHIFDQYPGIFQCHADAGDNILWVFIVFERLRGELSFWHPYFETTKQIDLLFDWESHELNELQDEIVVIDCQKWRSRVKHTWAYLRPVFEDHPDLFPSDNPLSSIFEWAWKLTSTRSFSWEGGTLIPFADNLNHSDLFIRYQGLNRHKMETDASFVDYSDFFAQPSSVQCRVPELGSRLDKYLRRSPDYAALEKLDAIWDIEFLLKDLKSDSDDESVRNYGDVSSINDDEYEQEELKTLQELEGYYFVMSTGSRTGFAENAQVFNAYGRLSNRELLLDYGFAIPHNRYDAFYFRLWDLGTGRSGLVHAEDVRSRAYKEDLGPCLDDYTEFLTLKLGKLNTQVLTYYRKLRKTNHLPLSVDAEIAAIDEVLSLYSCLRRGALEHDLMLLGQRQPARLRTAIIYRHSQQSILQRQIEYLELLRSILAEFKGGTSIDNFLQGKPAQSAIDSYPLRKYLRAFRDSLR